MEKNAKSIGVYRIAVALIGLWLTGLTYAQGLPIPTSPIDAKLTEKIWEFIKLETHAPADLPLPPILFDENIPKEARMVFQFPSEDAPPITILIPIRPNHPLIWNLALSLWDLRPESTH